MDPAPGRVLDRSCSICGRYAVLWAYTRDRLGKRELEAALVQGAHALDAYVWGNRWIAFFRCKTRGCLTHRTALAEPAKIRAVNARIRAPRGGHARPTGRPRAARPVS